MMKFLRILASAAIASWTSGCVWVVHTVDVKPVAARSETLTTKAPVKVHLLDGSTVMFRTGVAIAADTLRGAGTHYDRTVTAWSPVTRIPADSVAAIEVFDTRVEDGKSVIVSVLSTAALAGVVALAVSSIHLNFGGTGAMFARHP